MGRVASTASPWQIASRAPRRQWWSGRQAPTNAGKNTRTRPLPNDAIHFALWGGRHHKGPATTRPYIFRSLTEQGAREIRMNATVATPALFLISSLPQAPDTWFLCSAASLRFWLSVAINQLDLCGRPLWVMLFPFSTYPFIFLRLFIFCLYFILAYRSLFDSIYSDNLRTRVKWIHSSKYKQIY